MAFKSSNIDAKREQQRIQWIAAFVAFVVFMVFMGGMIFTGRGGARGNGAHLGDVNQAGLLKEARF